jgi:hypothetical protein
MDTYINLTTGQYPLTLEEIRRELLTVSLPKAPTEEQLRRCGYGLVKPTKRPAGTNVVGTAPRYQNGQFYQTWEVVESADLGEWQQELKRLLDTTYNTLLTQGWTYGTHQVDLVNSEELNWFFLECLSSQDDHSDEPVLFYTPNGDAVEFDWETGLQFVKDAVRYRRSLKRGYHHGLTHIRECECVADCKSVKRKLETKEVFQC